MDVKGESGVNIRPLRKSDRLRQARKIFRKSYLYYPSMRKKSKSNRRAKVSKFAKMLRPKNRPNRTPPSNLVSTDLRRSTRKRKVTTHFAEYENDTDSSRTDDIDLVYHSSRRIKHKAAQDELSAPRRHKRISNTEPAPRREGLRPRRSAPWSREESYQESDDNEDTSDSDVPVDQDETENVNDVDGAGDDDVESEDGNDMEEEEEGEDGEDEDGEEQDGKRRYDLRNRADVRRSSPEKERKLRPRSPRRVLHQGMSSKNNKESRRGGRVHKRHRFARDDDSDDSLLVDELDQGPPVPWTRSGNRNGAPLLFGGLDLHGTSPWGLNASASGWGHQGDGIMSTSAGIQTAGPSSKGGADIQPLQVDGSVSFDDIGGLSEYIDALKEMVFFPLLYPDFFANYHITPPRGVLLCGPPGTGKTLIARALACAASKAGQKVSFYMRKGADVLSKWVGEAERQLKLLFEEAQRNQPSIIFFDEIDGLAPVRSSKQEQIHNSIVSTLLALMDGLDSRGQVVLIGATNRIDAIDGALRRPGRFDREFVFSLPGCEARAEILDIHTRKWKEPPSKSLKMELAATCVGYCGADLKALCTEAAIRAFREKYPQVYTSDDKFLIDVDSIRIEKYHFLEAMSSITPAAHRGSIVLSRPLSSVVAPCLCRHFNKIMELISDIFPSLSSSDMTRLSVFSFGSSIPLVYRPRLLICGDEGAGLDHVGPAILHELEKFPVHSLGMASLLSDPGAKTPEEALVHIFGEARKTTPSILYLPQFHLWWDTAHEQLKVVLLTLLDELPSNFPILVLGTSSVAYADLEEMTSSVFSLLNAYQVDIPTIDDRSKFVEKLVEAVLSIPSEESSKSKVHLSLPELPKVPTEVGMPKASELRAKAEAEQHALRRLRMCFRDVCNRILYDKRFSVFHYPVTDEDAPNYHSIVQNPMDIATMLQRVDCGHYLLCSTFFQDVDLIVANAKAYNGEDYTGSRIVSRACELRDSVQGMLSQMDPSLVSFCDKIAAQGGPVPLPDDMRDLGFPPAPVVQPVSVTRMSARLRNAQPEVNISQSYEALKRPKKSSDADKPATNSDQTMEERSEAVEELDLHNLPSCQPKPHLPPQDCNSNPISSPKEPENNPIISDIPVPSVPTFPVAIEDAHDNSGKINNCDLSGEIIYVKQRLIEQTKNYGVPQLERLYTRVIKGVITDKNRGVGEDHRCSILKFLSKFSDDDSNF